MSKVTGRLKKTDLDSFKLFLDTFPYAYRDGKGAYQGLQVEINDKFEILYSIIDYPNHFIAYNSHFGSLIELFYAGSKPDVRSSVDEVKPEKTGNEAREFIEELIDVFAVAGLIKKELITEFDKGRLTKLLKELL